MSKYNYLDKHEIFHLFSKSPVRKDNHTLGQAVNKAGHTVLSKEVLSDDIPWFPSFNRNIAFIETKNATVGCDLLKITGAQAGIYKRNDIPYPENGIMEDGTELKYTNFLNYLWEKIDFSIEENCKIKNKDGKLVLLYHKDVPLTYITSANNSNQGSDETAARVWLNVDKNGNASDATRLVDSFIAPSDSIFNGFPSIGYTLTVSAGDEILKEDVSNDASSGYFTNAYGGIIYFNSTYSNTKISFFEYVGDSVYDTISEIKKEIGSPSTDTTEATGLYKIIENSVSGGEVNDLKDEVNDLKDEVNDLTGEVNDLTGEVNDLTGEVNDLKGEVNDLKGEVNDLTGEVGNIKGDESTKGSLTYINKNRLTTIFKKSRADGSEDTRLIISEPEDNYDTDGNVDGKKITIGLAENVATIDIKENDVVVSQGTVYSKTEIDNKLTEIGNQLDIGYVKSLNGIGSIGGSSITLSYDDEYCGSDILTTDTDKNTITINHARPWNYDGKSFDGVVKIENGVCYDADNNIISIIDNVNLSKGYIEADGGMKGMFNDNTTIISFISDLSNLRDGNYMFMSSNIQTFIGELGKLVTGTDMFRGCSNLKTVNTDLSSLQDGTGMFLNCTSLTPESVDLIIDMLPTYTDSTHTITISTATPEQISFANEKGWTLKTN